MQSNYSVRNSNINIAFYYLVVLTTNADSLVHNMLAL